MGNTSKKLRHNIPKIMNAWEQRALDEVKSAHHQESLALRNSLPEYLHHLADTLAKNLDRAHARQREDKEESTRIGKKHGGERAASLNYTIDQMIVEYHILRQVLFDVLEETDEIPASDREVIVCSIEQAVNDASTQFTQSVKEFQQNLAHTLVHDLRNPLSIVKLSAELTARGKGELQKNVQLIIKNVGRMDSMISQLLDADKKREGDILAEDFEDCDLDFIVKEIIEESAMVHGKRFQYVSNGPCVGRWNASGIRRLIENLTTNAIKYSEEGAPISFEVKQDQEAGTLSVHNDGTEIPAEEQDLLFDKYRRAKNSGDIYGWGLGLSIVSSIVKDHAGSIKVFSGQGHGTTFEFTIPKSAPNL